MMKAGTVWFLFHLLIAHFCERKFQYAHSDEWAA